MSEHKSDDEVMSTHDDAEMINRPHLWTHPLLPLKKRRVEGELPVAVLNYERGKLVVYENMTIFGTSFGKEVIKHEFENAHQVTAQGWMVD